MNKKEISEIRRRLTLENSGADCIRGCYVSEKREIITEFELPLMTFPDDERERYLNIFKKVLSGGIGKNLINVDFSTRQVTDGEEQKLLSGLRDGISGKSDACRRFYEKIVPAIPGDEKCVLLLLHENYDVPAKSEDDSTETFRFVICAVCPVKEKDSGLCYEGDSKLFRTKAKEHIICPPEYGFMYPRFDDRCTNIYGSLYYSRTASGQNSFTDAAFAAPLPMAAEKQKDTFGDVLRGSVADQCSFELVQTVRDHICDVIEAYKADKFADEPPTITKTEICDLLRGCDITEDHITAFAEDYDESFGKGAELTPQNLMDLKKIELKNDSMVIKIDPDRADLVEVKIIDGAKYIVIRVEDGIECNGIDIKIK
ncbi:MAG: DUF4317 domain-containing protein [Clostridia bacterium]|nr:DUF4317 domain-containing protein [Clostridia bacterium]